MPIINLTEEELTKLWEAVNNGTEPPPELAGRLFPSFIEKLAAGGKFDFEALNRIRIPTMEYAGKRQEGVILAGAEKVSVNTEAVKNPTLIADGARAFGSQCIVLGMDVKKINANPQVPSGYEMVIHGGRTATGIDALRWAKEAERLGAGEICLNSIDADGTRDGYEIDLTALISSQVRIPVIASGGAGKPEHLLDVLTRGKADAALIASMVHYRTYSIAEIKGFLHERGVKTRMHW